ncbi:hypothetical protein [Wolbachia endosymbiont of Scaptomyza pallida]|uniref:hypothetical protein n=1 Tax=Wolbachia endosymbiont of Scaptomyza pallida TaxID=375923 RepID=UPI0029149FC3|nr:hypothetical protein [Wolbachia endosymbiont of Scaptomyza pallida]MDU8921396.1 hypothetical protein [Wolbachia endosymbiont of Scaptomyza pallida]
MVLFALSINSLVVLNIRRILRHQFPVMALDLLRPHWQGARVREVLCEMVDDNPQVNVILTPFQSPNDYSRNYLGHFQGDLLRIGDVGQVHRTASVMMNNGWQDVNRHTQLFQEISNVLFPLRQGLVTSEAEFQAVLHGLFYTLGNPARVVIEFQLERGGRIDLVLSRFVGRDDTHPIGIELKFARTAGQVRQKSAEANRQLKRYTQCGGCERITDGDQMVLSYAVFNNGARGPDTLISVRDVLNVRNNLGQFYR